MITHGSFREEELKNLKDIVAKLKSNSPVIFNGKQTKTFKIAKKLEEEGKVKIEKHCCPDDPSTEHYTLSCLDPGMLSKLDEIIAYISAATLFADDELLG
jgi:hypothetical protein